jgi:class 3 adenylate cyclase
MNVVVSIHIGSAAVSEIGSSDPPIVMAIGEAVDVANELRKVAAAQGKQFAISEAVYAAAEIDFPAEDNVTVRLPGIGAVTASLSPAGPALPAAWRQAGERRRNAFQRLWSG